MMLPLKILRLERHDWYIWIHIELSIEVMVSLKTFGSHYKLSQV